MKFPAAPLTLDRYYHVAALLPSGKVLVAGGIYGYDQATASCELYDPATDTWFPAASLDTERYSHTGTLLTSGKFLVAGGYNRTYYPSLASVELFDPGLAPDPARQPGLSAANVLQQREELNATSSGSSNAVDGATLSTGFAPPLEASSGATNDSATNMPVFEVERLDNEQISFVPSGETANITDTSFIGQANASACPWSGPALVRVWVNGVPSAARYLVVGGDAAVTSDTIFTNGFDIASTCGR